MNGKSNKLWLILILLPAAAFKFNVWTHTQPIVIPRSSTYMQSATELLERGSYSGVETLRRTPVYPVFLAGVLRLSGGNMRAVTFAQHILGLASAFLIMLLALRLWGSYTAAITTGLIVSLHPSFLLFERSIESELVSVFLLSGMLLLLTKAILSAEPRHNTLLAAGLAGGAAALTRPELAVCIIIPSILLARKRGGLKLAAYFFLPFMIMVAGWMVRNFMLFNYFSLSPMGAITSLQTSGPMIDWDAPTHREFKTVYAKLLKENGNSHLTVVNRTIAAVGNYYPDITIQKAFIEAAELGKETFLSHPFKYLWAARINFRDFLRSTGDFDEPGKNDGVTPEPIRFLLNYLLPLSLLGLTAAAFWAPSGGLFFLFLTTVAIMTANCLVEIGLSRRSFEILPLLSLFASYLFAAAASGLTKLRRRHTR